MEEMGVAESFIKYVIKQDLPMRCWRNILYTKIHYGNAPKLFNQAYVKDYARKYDIQDLLEQARKSDPNFKDPTTTISVSKAPKHKPDVVSKISQKPDPIEQQSLFDNDDNLTEEQQKIRSILMDALQRKREELANN